MRKTRVPFGLALVLAMAFAGLTAGATHGDVIEEVIPDSDVEVGFDVVADGFTTPVKGTTAPGNNRQLYVVDQVGKIWAIKLAGGPAIPDRHLFADVGADGAGLLVPLGAFGPGTFDERGLMGLAFHPDYRRNGRVYTLTSEPANGHVADFDTLPAGEDPNHHAVLREWRVDNPRSPRAVVDAGSSRVMMRIAHPQFNHNAGDIAFGPDRMLYMAVGDGGAADDQGIGHAEGGNGQDLTPGNVLGKILRINPQGHNSANGQYGIPSDNPFLHQGVDGEIWAYGFRNPFRMSFDTATGYLYAADVGQNDIEDVDIVWAGGNYGWPVKEGTFLFDMNGDDPGFTTVDSPGVPAGMIDPIAQYDHDEGVSVTGGFVYHGNSIPELQGSYVFGDWTSSFAGPAGRVFHLTDSGIAELGEPGIFVSGFGQDARGEVYVLGALNIAPVGETGVVMRLVPAGD